MLVAGEQNQTAAEEWLEWAALVRSEHRSLTLAGNIYWGAAGDVLRRQRDPLAAWLDAATKLEPHLRTRARRYERGMIDPGVHLVMPAVNAAAMMCARGKPLWLAAFEWARRHFFVDSPPKNEVGYYLCSYMFAGFRRVFGDDQRVLSDTLGLLPTRDHVDMAHKQLGGASLESQISDRA